MNTFLNDEACEEAKPWSDESEKTKILTVVHDPKEVEKGRQKELNSLCEVLARLHGLGNVRHLDLQADVRGQNG